MKKSYEKLLMLLTYAAISYIKLLVCAVVLAAAAFGVLNFTGVYARIERALDLKYNSPFVIAPIYGFLALAAISLLVGFLLYFYKYKRTKTRSAFYKVVSAVLKEKEKAK